VADLACPATSPVAHRGRSSTMADRGDGRLLLSVPLGEGDLACTSAHMAGQQGIAPEDVAEAVKSRSLDYVPRRQRGRGCLTSDISRLAQRMSAMSRWTRGSASGRTRPSP